MCFAIILILDSKIRTVTGKIFVTSIFCSLLFSCSNPPPKEKKDIWKEVKEREGNKFNNSLVYLDTAENIYNALCQGWAMEDDEEALKGMTEDSKLIIPYRSFYFAANGTFVKNPRNAMEYGNWVYNDVKKTITLNYAGGAGNRDVYKIAALAADELKLLNIGINTSTILKFISRGRRFKDPGEEPFNLKNNRWRIPPAKRETDSAIHRRLKENLYFFILFYRSAVIKDDKSVSFWGLPSCFKWYGGGIYLKSEDELDDNWIECFYSKEQAMKAYRLSARLLSEKYEWPKGESNWLKQNLAVLEQMFKKMDEIH